MTTVVNNNYQYGGALVPHYGPNNNQYYNNYLAGASPGQRNVGGTTNQDFPQHPPQPFQTYQEPHQAAAVNTTTPTEQPEFPFHPPSEICFPTPPNSTASSGYDEEDSTKLTAAKQAIENDDIPPEIVASQERALAEIKQRQSQRALVMASTSQHQEHDENSSSSLNAALVVPPPTTLAFSNISNTKTKVITEAIHPHKYTMKKQRKRRTAGATVGGAVVGGIALGPAGAFLGGAAGGLAANKLCKVGERHAQRNWERNNFQRGAERSKIVQCEATIV